MLFGLARGRVHLSGRDQIDAQWSGSRLRLSDWGMPAGIEALAGRRASPSFNNNPAGFAGLKEADAFDSLQAGWTRQGVARGSLAVRYGYSETHLDTTATGPATGQSRIDLETGVVGDTPPLANRAVAHASRIAGGLRAGRMGAGGPAASFLDGRKLGTGGRSESLERSSRFEFHYGEGRAGIRGRLYRGAREPRAHPERGRVRSGHHRDHSVADGGCRRGWGFRARVQPARRSNRVEQPVGASWVRAHAALAADSARELRAHVCAAGGAVPGLRKPLQPRRISVSMGRPERGRTLAAVGARSVGGEVRGDRFRDRFPLAAPVRR